MDVSYEAKLLEIVVFDRARALEARGHGAAVRDYHRERAAAYGAEGEAAREEAHREVHRRWFSQLGLDRAVPRAAREAAGRTAAWPPLFVHTAASPADEGGEVYEKSGKRTVVIAVRPSRFADEAVLLGFLRHELRLAADLLDPAFGFGGGFPDGPGAVPTTLAKERYRVLWKVSADGRLDRGGFAGLRGREDWIAVFDRIFSFLPGAARGTAFQQLWEGPRPPHARLLECSLSPRRALAGEAGEEPAADDHSPGTRCPLCGFPTFDWHPRAASLAPEVLETIARRHPGWRAASGACAACVERYELACRGAFGRS